MNAIAPGPTDTEATRSDRARSSILKQMLAQMPLARVGTPEDLVGTVPLPACPTTSAWMTGQVLNVDGGQIMRPVSKEIDRMNPETRNLIDGRLVDASSGATFPNVNPATEEVIGVTADAHAATTWTARSRAARRAFDTTDWSTNHAFRAARA